ncbi:hypothetical protein [Nocardiopsis lambiniae]|uniref:DUF4439 domain-containing protein n=1 Tax=Nocardiopsis lambiniae TaxID=3075539 RepID=A0ABU2MAR5_9ACTN|nr:hypothetical protein [Nocardiopsis sp. DSM 44743]MDT0329046.1 hypothetical protein [Nocardiopsis sp. DSM 44743]
MPADHRTPLDEEQQAPPSEDLPEPTHTTALTWWLTIGSMVLVGALIAALVLSAGEGGPSGDPDAVGALAETAMTAREDLTPVIAEMEEWLPTDGSHPSLEPVDAATVHGWRTTAHDVVTSLSTGDDADPVRTGLISSASLLVVVADTYSKAALVEDEDLRMDLLHTAMDVRNEAVVGWSVAAAHLDEAAVGAGIGPVHAHLPAAPGLGALEPDGTAGDRTEHEYHH